MPQDYSRALRGIAVAMEKRPMPVALVYRSIALAGQAGDTGNYDSLEKALLDLEYAEALMGRTQDVLMTQLWARRIGCELKQHEDPVAAETHLKALGRYVEEQKAISRPFARNWQPSTGIRHRCVGGYLPYHGTTSKAPRTQKRFRFSLITRFPASRDLQSISERIRSRRINRTRTASGAYCSI